MQVVVVNEDDGDGDGDYNDEFIIHGGEFGMVSVGFGVGDGWNKSNRLWQMDGGVLNLFDDGNGDVVVAPHTTQLHFTPTTCMEWNGTNIVLVVVFSTTVRNR